MIFPEEAVWHQKSDGINRKEYLVFTNKAPLEFPAVLCLYSLLFFDEYKINIMFSTVLRGGRTGMTVHSLKLCKLFSDFRH